MPPTGDSSGGVGGQAALGRDLSRAEKWVAGNPREFNKGKHKVLGWGMG